MKQRLHRIGTLLNEIKLPLFLAVAVRVAYLSVADNYFNGDTGARLQISHQWMNFPSLFCGYDWLPLHFYMLGIAMKLTGSYDLVPRLLTLVMGVLTLIPFYALVRKIFTPSIAYFSALLLALLGAHVQLSVITLTEVPSLLFLLCAMYYLWNFVETRKDRYLIFSALFISGFNLLRFEGWMFSFLLLLVVMFNRATFKQMILFCVLAGAAPVWVMWETWLNMGNPFYSLNYSDYEVKNQVAMEGKTIWANIVETPYAFLFLSWLTVPVGLWLSVKERGRRDYIFLLFVPFAYAFFKAVTLTLTGQFRYFLPYSVLSIPFTVLAVSTLLDKANVLANQKVKSVMQVLLFLALLLPGINYCLLQPLSNDKIGVFPNGFTESTAWARKHLPAPRIFVDNRNFSANQWMVYANQVRIYNDDPESTGIVDYISGRYWVGEVFNPDALADEIRDKNITHLVFFYDGEMSNALPFEKPEEEWSNIRFERVYSKHGYRIYAVKAYLD